jgi:hypothetical protein
MSFTDEFEPPRGDLHLVEGERKDIFEEARLVAGDGWLDEPNIYLAGQVPRRLIEEGYFIPVRDCLRMIKAASFS